MKEMQADCVHKPFQVCLRAQSNVILISLVGTSPVFCTSDNKRLPSSREAFRDHIGAQLYADL